MNSDASINYDDTKHKSRAPLQWWRHVAARVPVSNSDNETSSRRNCNAQCPEAAVSSPGPAGGCEADGRISRFINT